MGGTFTARSPFYQDWFVKRCYDAMNGKDSESLDEAKKKNETAASRCIGLTIETRPDWFRIQHADQALNFGATRVELGVQTVFDTVLYKMERGHTVTDSINATKIAKDCGFKICYHLMPGICGSNEKKDIETFISIFQDSNFKPDMIKIYPTLTIKGTKLFELWKNGEYEPITTKKATELIAKIKTFVPEWVRIQRIQRDIPSSFIDAGVDKSNLRQFVEDEMKKHGIKCRCIRCREIGFKSLKQKIEIDKDDLLFNYSFYKASGAEEIFISLVEKNLDAIVGYLRLRNIIDSHRFELQKKPCMIIRELKVVGRELSLGKRTKDALQHKGCGKDLMNEAQRICKEDFDKRYLFVLSGVGVKEYYRKLGFKDNGVYLSKTII